MQGSVTHLNYNRGMYSVELTNLSLHYSALFSKIIC
jgi:hypothetical protein